MTSETAQWAVRRLGAVSLLVVGAVHLQQYLDGYSEIDTIGTLFVLNVVGATIMGVALILPVERSVPRWGTAIVALLASGGTVLAATSFAMLLIAERRPLFGFMEPGFNPGAIMLSRISELATVVLLGTFLTLLWLRGSARPNNKATSQEVVEFDQVGRGGSTMKRVAVPSLLTVVALVLAACGGEDGSTDTSSSGGAGTTVSVADVDGVSVVVDADGQALYASDEEAGGDVLCVSDGCLAFWAPLTTDADVPTGDVSGAELGVVERPDGASQVTLDGRPLYTFSEDDPGQVNGDGLSDSFDGQTLTWRVITAEGTTDSGSGSGSDDDNVYDY
ncbi:MAG TPA: hypothetical protein VIP77_03105 [Jiangellaceae bacterium]